MKLTFEIEILEDGGVKCKGHFNGADVYDQMTANIMAVGALEIAKQSLLAQRWGMKLNPNVVITELP